MRRTEGCNDEGRCDADGPRVVIAHDFMETYGGAERVTEQFARAFPTAPVYALLGDPAIAERMGVAERFHSILPPSRRLLRHYRLGTAGFPALAALKRLPEADVLLTSSYAFAHHLRTVNAAPQVCYCHSPLRFAWSMTDDYASTWTRGRVASSAFSLFAGTLRRTDRAASRRVTRYLTQSEYTAQQIRQFYERGAHVVGAPIDCEHFVPSGRDHDGYFLFVGRITEPYKRLGVTLEAFRRLGLPLTVAGDGPALAGLRRQAPENVTFTGHLGDEDLVRLMQGCRATIFPSRDDFGLIPLEVNACGRPVLAYAGGGALHTVRPGVSGAFFHEQSADAIVEAVRAFDDGDYDPERVREHALDWDAPAFRARVRSHVREVHAASSSRRPTPTDVATAPGGVHLGI